MKPITAAEAREVAKANAGHYSTEYQQQLDSIMMQIDIARQQGYMTLCLKDPLAIFWIEHNLYTQLTTPPLSYKINWLTPGILEISWEDQEGN